MRIHARNLTDPRACPYLPGRESRLDLLLTGDLSGQEHDAVLEAGVRRFGRVLFRNACVDCSRCIPLRVPLATFAPTRSQRRVLRKNLDIEVEVGEPAVDPERLDLYRRFHEERERSRGWPPSSIDSDEYLRTFVENSVPTLEFRYRLEGRLAGIGYADASPRALNSVYGFHDPELSRRSLGTFDVLTEIAEARLRGKEHVYLGFYVETCTSMEYKRSFRPCEALLGGEWVPFA